MTGGQPVIKQVYSFLQEQRGRKSRCSVFLRVVDHFRNNAFGQESDTREADPHILYPMPAASIRGADVNYSDFYKSE